MGDVTAPMQARGARRRDAMVEAATELFLDNGFENTSLDMVIARAGGSRRTLYAYFGGKEGLFATVVRHVCQNTLRQIEGLEMEERPPHAALTDFARGFLATLLEPRHTAIQRLIVAESARFPELGREFFRAAPDVAYGEVERYFRRMQDNGRLHFIDPGVSAIQFLQMIGGDLNMRAMYGLGAASAGDPEVVRHVDLAVDVFLNGCQPRGR